MKLLGETTVYSGWGRFKILDVQLSDGSAAKRQIEDHGEAAAVLPYDAERKVALLARQPRVGPLYAGLDPHLTEVAAGLIDPGESGEGAVRREALEELGVRLVALEPVVIAWTTPGVCSERGHLFLAPYAAADRIAAGGGLASEAESIEVLETPLKELARQADAGELTDLKTLALVLMLMRRRPELF